MRRAWLLLAGAIALHVSDEALTGFLDVYNPTVQSLRERVPWLPLPIFTFEIWLGGLLLGVALMLAVTGFVHRGARWTRYVAYVLSVLMIANAAGHTVGTIAGRTFSNVSFPRPMPGFYSSPFLFAAACYLLLQLRRSGHKM